MFLWYLQDLGLAFFENFPKASDENEKEDDEVWLWLCKANGGTPNGTPRVPLPMILYCNNCNIEWYCGIRYLYHHYIHKHIYVYIYIIHIFHYTKKLVTRLWLYPWPKLMKFRHQGSTWSSQIEQQCKGHTFAERRVWMCHDIFISIHWSSQTLGRKVWQLALSGCLAMTACTFGFNPTASICS